VALDDSVSWRTNRAYLLQPLPTFRGKTMPARHFSQTPPDRANELFDKLLATSDGAAKTRERLFADLKDELELLASLQEQHLFPILQRHGMEDLLRAATGDNEETGRLLAELGDMPKNSSEFLGKVAELRKAFQRHIRDDRKELLPAVLKVLSDEEAQAVAEQVEDDVASFEETKRTDSSAAAEGWQTLPKAAEGLSDMVHLGTESAQTAALGVQDLSRECLRMTQKRLQTNLDGWVRLAQCRSIQDAARIQISLLQDNIEQTLSNSFHLADLTVKLAEKTARQGARTSPHSRDFA
jgi:hypothetical protein